jgi:hypothetical protein
MSLLMRLAVGTGVLILVAGCGVLPQIAHQPTYHNPFPQLTKVAVAPFFNLSSEPTVDGRQFASAYMGELQAIPGFEVVPFPVVEEKIKELGLSLANPVEVRKLAEALEADAIVIGAVTDFSPYYPPRCALQVEWYAANPCFHSIPVGYGLPWGTPEEEYIPDALVLETEFGLAREQLQTQTPAPATDTTIPVHDPGRPKAGNLMAMLSARDRKLKESLKTKGENDRTAARPKQYPGQQLSYQEDTALAASNQIATLPSVMAPKKTAGTPTPAGINQGSAPQERPPGDSKASAVNGARHMRPASANSENPNISGITLASSAMPLPPDWPDPQGLVPPPPSPVCPECQPTFEPVLRHTRAYNGNDVHFTTALESYLFFRDEARQGGWQSYLQRSDDFIRFCCHMHITEMLTARGGAGETRVVWRWPERR